MGGSPSRPPAPPSPAEVAAAQMRAQENARKKLEAERGASADRFLSENAITDDFRQGIFSQSDAARDVQSSMLDTQIANTLQDIRQRNAARGLGQSSSGQGILGQARSFGESSRSDLFNSARRRAENRIADQQRFLDNAASDIRSGRDFNSARASFRNEMDSANKAFEQSLVSAKTGDQRNAAFRNFETDRRLAASRFQESVNQFGNQGTLAAALGSPSDTKTKDSAGQVGSFTSGLS